MKSDLPVNAAQKMVANRSSRNLRRPGEGLGLGTSPKVMHAKDEKLQRPLPELPGVPGASGAEAGAVRAGAGRGLESEAGPSRDRSWACWRQKPTPLEAESGHDVGGLLAASGDGGEVEGVAVGAHAVEPRLALLG